MSGGKLALLFAGAVSMLAGIYLYFIADNAIGPVFIGLGAIFVALFAALSGRSGKEDGDAG